MANANAIVEKMAGLGLRHGEKAGVAIAMTVFFLCVGMAVSRPGIDTTPDQVKKAAQASQSNLDRKEERDTIIKRLEETDNIKPTNFAAAVEEQIKVQLVGDTFKPLRTWVTPEPGAGLIMDTPELIAPTELYAYAGRGGLLVYDLDEQGNKIKSEGEEEEKAPQKYGNTRRRRSGGGMGGSMMGGMGGRRKKARKSQKDIEREEKEDRDRQERQLKGGLVGDAPKDEPKKDVEKEEGGPYKEITRGYRWVAITGTLDHSQMLANYRTALKNPAIAHPQYLRLDLQRRIQQADGTWSEWQDVDADKNYAILDNAPDHEVELAPKEVLPEGLVDPLPFLTAGLWEKVHIASLVPKEKRELPEETKSTMGMGAIAGGGGSDNMGAMMEMQSRMMQNRGGMRGMEGGGSEMMGMGMSMGMGMGGAETVGNFWKSEEKKVMVRALDFTVEPNNTYRYRVRIVVANPTYNRDDVSPKAALDKKKKTLAGPWSKETDVVSMPPDVQPYAVAVLPASGKSDTKVRFEVIRFNPGDGWTVPHRFEAGVGEVIGDPYREAVPKSDGSGTRKEEIDFNSRQIVLDVDGGGLQNLPSALVGPSIERPALTALLRRDGAMVVHNQADDLNNEFRRDAAANYKHELDESNENKKRENSQGSSYGGMMGSMMGGRAGMKGGRGGANMMGGR